MNKVKTLVDNSVVCLMAPTASGKTALAYELYDTGHYELISVDSALIYRDMNIGTAKPTVKELDQYPHHLVDIIDPTQSYSVSEFVQDVERLIGDIHRRGKIPLLVGGTMMYFMALFDGLSKVPDSDAKVRSEVEQWRQKEGIEALHQYLAEVDPLAYQRLNSTDTQRVTRAIEVFKQTGRPLSDWQAEPKIALANNPQQQWLGFAVMPDRQWLHQRIEQRLEIMWQQGLIEEVIELLASYPLKPNMPSMRSVGYRQVLEYLVKVSHPVLESENLTTEEFYKEFLNNDETANNNYIATGFLPKLHTESQKLACLEMRNKALYATRQLAKRQYTWLRKLTKLTQEKNFACNGSACKDSNLFYPTIYASNSMTEVKSHLK